MAEVLKVGNRTITDAEIVPLLAHYQLLPQLLKELIIDEAIAPYTCTPEEIASARQQFNVKHQLTTEAAHQDWLQRNGMTSVQWESLTSRGLRIEKFKQATWEHKLESYFLKRKGQLDKVIYALIRTKDMGLAQELYFRIQEGEQSFSELARDYSLGMEAQTGGLIGPVELSTAHPTLARMLAVSQPNQLWPPLPLGEWFVIVRLEKFIPAQLDESMRQRLMNELFTTWLQEQLLQANPVHSLGVTATPTTQ
jgi:parvulin-like peptidyl-prolyl isomerase